MEQEDGSFEVPGFSVYISVTNMLVIKDSDSEMVAFPLWQAADLIRAIQYVVKNAADLSGEDGE